VDQGVLDPVVPVAFTDAMVNALRGRGADVTYERHPTGTHQNITDSGQAAGPVAEWLSERLSVR
jgi:predicted esterase